MRVESGIGGCWGVEYWGLTIKGEGLKSSLIALMDDGWKSVLCTCNDECFFPPKYIYIRNSPA